MQNMFEPVSRSSSLNDYFAVALTIGSTVHRYQLQAFTWILASPSLLLNSFSLNSFDTVSTIVGEI